MRRSVRTAGRTRATLEGEPPVLAPDARAALLAHPWRGSVRELRHVIERALAFSPAPAMLQARHLRFGA
jgi:transcriptional regulator with PAS, ATPase and Fis domain